jgi:serine/threonine protein kinase
MSENINLSSTGPSPLNLKQYVLSQVHDSKGMRTEVFREKRAMEIALSLAQTLEYLHNLGVTLRNIDLTNIVLTQNSD